MRLPSAACGAIFTDSGAFGPFNGGQYVFRNDFIKSNPDAVRAFVSGVAKAIEWERDTPRSQVIAEMTKIINERHRPNEDTSTLKYWLSVGIPSKGGVISDKDFTRWESWMKDTGALNGSLDAHNLYTNEFNPYANGGSSDVDPEDQRPGRDEDVPAAHRTRTARRHRRHQLRRAAGEFLVLVGPSGCGKSTLLDLIAGLTEPAGGQILLDGKPVTGPGLDRGVVFQQYALFPWRTAQANVEFGLEVKGVSRRRRAARAREVLELVGLEGFADRYPHELSGGMKQRVAIARSLAYEPDVLLMDEPYAALDAQTRESLQDELLAIWRRTGTTIVFITHSIDEAVYLGERVAVMTSRPGRIKATVDVSLDAPAPGEDARSTAQFTAKRREIWQLLHDEVQKAHEIDTRERLNEVA